MIPQAMKGDHMHGLINCSIQSYISDAFGVATWTRVAEQADLGLAGFEAMLTYDDALTERALVSAAAVTGRDRADLLEDLGTYLVSAPRLEGVRRLLRFGGVEFEECLHSRDDLADRAKLAVSDLDLPRLELNENPDGSFDIHCKTAIDGFGYVLMGLLRVMADDYGVLVVLEHGTADAGGAVVSITVIDHAFAEGRHFDLGAGPR